MASEITVEQLAIENSKKAKQMEKLLMIFGVENEDDILSLFEGIHGFIVEAKIPNHQTRVETQTMQELIDNGCRWLELGKDDWQDLITIAF